MRSSRLFVSMILIFMIIGISIDSAKALEWSDWANKWLKIKIKINATCEDLNDNKLFKESVKDTAGIYIKEGDGSGNFEAYLVYQKEDGSWDSASVELNFEGGSPDDAILISSDESPLLLDGDLEINYEFVMRLTGKEKNELFKTGTVKSVVGMATLDATPDAYCFSLLSFSGKYLKNEKVPQEVWDTIP